MQYCLLCFLLVAYMKFFKFTQFSLSNLLSFSILFIRASNIACCVSYFLHSCTFSYSLCFLSLICFHSLAPFLRACNIAVFFSLLAFFHLFTLTVFSFRIPISFLTTLLRALNSSCFLLTACILAVFQTCFVSFQYPSFSS